jgi:allantoin racemase
VRLLVINPNATAAMTARIETIARAMLPREVEVIARTNAAGPPAIQGPEDGAAALPGLLAEVRRGLAEAVDAVVIACFDDTGLAEARALAPCPVIGIGEAGFHAAMLLGRRFSVVTTLAVSVPVIAGNLAAYGLAGACARVRASDVAVLDLERPGSGAEAMISAEIGRALAEDGSGAIVLGCAGMADLAARLTQEHGVPVIDGVAAACGMAWTLARMQAA